MQIPKYFETGDKILIKDLAKIYPKNEYGLKENEIYEVVYTGTDKESLWVRANGKFVYIGSYKYEYIEVVELVKRKTLLVGERIIITDRENIEGAIEENFYNHVSYEIKEVFDEESILISNGEKNLIIMRKEYDYIQNTSEKEVGIDNIMLEIVKINIQNLIDKALDRKDYEELKALRLYTNEKVE